MPCLMHLHSLLTLYLIQNQSSHEPASTAPLYLIFRRAAKRSCITQQADRTERLNIQFVAPTAETRCGMQKCTLSLDCRLYIIQPGEKFKKKKRGKNRNLVIYKVILGKEKNGLVGQVGNCGALHQQRLRSSIEVVVIFCPLNDRLRIARATKRIIT